MIHGHSRAYAIAAVFFALAIGIALGATVLSSGQVDALRDDKTDLSNRLASANTRADHLSTQLDTADAFDAALAERTVAGALTDRTVLLVGAPDAVPDDVAAVSSLIGAAGGTVTGRITLTDAFVDPASADRLRTIVANVVPAGVTLGTDAVDPGSMAGDLLGATVLTPGPEAPAPAPEARAMTLDTLRDGGFLTVDGDLQPASLAVVVTGPPDAADAAAATDTAGTVIGRFAAALDTRSLGTVLAGRPASATGNGAIALVRADSGIAGVSTVDNVDRAAGRITVVLAAAEQATGGVGRYGVGQGADAVTVGAAGR